VTYKPLAEWSGWNAIFDAPWSDFEQWFGGPRKLIELILGEQFLVAQIGDDLVGLQSSGGTLSACDIVSPLPTLVRQGERVRRYLLP